MSPSIQSLGTILLCAVLFGLGLVVLARDPRAPVNRLFAFSMLTIIGWIGSISLYLSTKESDPNILLGRLAFASASAIPFSLLWMFESLEDVPTRRSKRILWATAAACVLFVALSSFTPLIVAGSATGSSGRNFIYGPLHRLFGIYFLCAFGLALYRLSSQLRSASGIRKLQLRYLLLGILLGGLGGMTTNLVIPLVWGTSQYSLLGPYFTLIMALFAAHAIVRYRLMDIRVVIKSGVAYASGIVVAVSLFVGFAILLRHFTGDSADTISFAAAITIAAVTAILFQPLNTRLQALLNRYLYRQSYDYQRTIRDASRRLSTILDPLQLLTYLVGAIENIFRVERACVYLRGEQTTAPLATVAASGQWAASTFPLLTPGESTLLTFIEREKRACVKDDPVPLRDSLAAAARQELQRLGGEVALPFIEETDVSGLLLIGPKLSGDPYFAEDLDLISTLVSQATIALQNARLYRQVVIANEYIENILSTMESGVIAIDSEGTVTLFNSAAAAITQLEAEALKGKPLEHLPVPVAEALRGAAAGTRPLTQVEMTVHNRAGHPVPIISSSSALRDRSGALLGAVTVFSDLSRLKELEREKWRAERLASIGALAAGIAHEIKNPLVAIKTFAELLPERFHDEDFHGDFSKVVVHEIDRIDSLVGRLRGLTPNAQRMAPLDLVRSIQETLALLRAQLEQAKIVVKTSYQRGLPLISGDADQLRQLFLNVFVNAIEAMHSNGELKVRVADHKTLGSRVVVAEIEDSGDGIPSSLVSKVFDPFVTTKEKGSGLGLSICRGIADAHRATIYATNNKNRPGAVIAVEFPALVYAPSATTSVVSLNDAP
jgi:PAS domain S-box-containing protein